MSTACSVMVVAIYHHDISEVPPKWLIKILRIQTSKKQYDFKLNIEDFQKSSDSDCLKDKATPNLTAHNLLENIYKVLVLQYNKTNEVKSQVESHQHIWKNIADKLDRCFAVMFLLIHTLVPFILFICYF